MIIWAVLLMLQNACFTWVSRSRNSTRVSEHALASVCSNGLFIINLWFSVDYLHHTQGWGQRLMVAAFYIFFTTVGAVVMHLRLLKRKV
jgi:hypothetical protein